MLLKVEKKISNTSCVLYTAVTESGTMLPKGWQRMEDEQKKPYYWNIPTGRTQYTKPTGENLERLVSGSYHVPQSASLYIQCMYTRSLASVYIQWNSSLLYYGNLYEEIKTPNLCTQQPLN